jgi:HSP20 family protein
MDAGFRPESDIPAPVEDTMSRLTRYSPLGQMQRAVALATNVDESKATAVYEKGVLKLTLPKKAGDASRRPTIS